MVENGAKSIGIGFQAMLVHQTEMSSPFTVLLNLPSQQVRRCDITSLIGRSGSYRQAADFPVDFDLTWLGVKSGVRFSSLVTLACSRSLG